jgi:hypothetical protein
MGMNKCRKDCMKLRIDYVKKKKTIAKLNEWFAAKQHFVVLHVRFGKMDF